MNPDIAQTCQASLILILGAAASWQDIRTKKIRNSLLFTILTAFIIMAAAGIISPAPWTYRDILINAAAGSAASLILWRAGVWPAGDTKFFALLSLIVPLKYYSNNFLPYFPAFALLVNSFFIAFTLLTLMVIADAARRVLRVATGSLPLKQYLLDARNLFASEIPIFLKSTLTLIGIFIPARIAGDHLLAFTSSFFSSFLVLHFLLAFMLYRQIMQFMSKYITITQCALVALAGLALKYVLTGFNLAELASYAIFTLKIALAFMLAISAVVKIFSTYIKTTQTRPVPAAQLEPGMLIDKEFWTSYLNENKETGFHRALRPEGLEPGQIEALNKTLPGQQLVPVVNTYPFAPVIFAGALLTMALKQSLLHFILAWLKR